MKLKFKNQDFQKAATAAVCDVFEGQPYQNPSSRRQAARLSLRNMAEKKAKDVS